MEKIDTTFLDTIKTYLEPHGFISNDFYQSFSSSVPISEHIRGLVYAKLSQNTRWEKVYKKHLQINKLFFDFDRDTICRTDANYFLKGLIDLKVGRFRKNLCLHLHNNIKIVETALKAYETGSEEYLYFLLKNLKGLGLPLVFEYLHYAGVDRIKPDIHVKRILSRYYVGEDSSTQFNDKGVFEWAKTVRSQGKYNLTQIDILLWRFCSKDNAEICESTPKCSLCPLSKVCKYGQNLIL